jgi:hypothetical protein
VEFRIDRIFDEIEKGGQEGEPLFLVFCLVPSDTLDMKVKMSSDVIDDSSMSPK